MQTLLQDVRYGLRMLVKNPGFTGIAVLMLALGIGANTAIFTVMNSVLLSTLPVKAPQELVVLTNPDAHGMSDGSEDGDRDLLTYPEFQDLSQHNQVLSGLLATDSNVHQLDVSVVDSGQSSEGSPAQVAMVSGSYFGVLGVEALRGRTFGTEVDEQRDANPVAVISYNFWQSRFGGEASVLGRKIRIRRSAYDIIGVTPPRFFGVTVGTAPDVWVPLTMQAEVFPGEDWLSTEKNPVEKTMWLQVLGRRKPGVSVAQAKAGVELTFQQYLKSQIGSGITESARHDFLNQHLALTEGSHGASTLRAQFGTPLLILMGVVGLVLLIACANVANLLLARAASRQKEIAVRVAMGAGRARLFRQLLTESVLLAAIGGVLGLLFAQWADAVLLRLVSRGPLPIPLDTHPDAKILAFTLGVSLLTGVLFGLAPAFRAAKVDLNSVLKGTSRAVIGGSAQGGKVPVGKILVVAQVALSLLLLIVAGLFVHSFQKLTEVKLGYDRDHLLLFGVNPITSGYTEPEIAPLYQDLLERLRAVPGVRGVTLSQNGLFSHSESADQISIEGFKPKSGQKMGARFDEVGPNYFTTVGIPVLMGRDIGPQDEGSGQRVGLINQTMARYYFGNDNPIGRRIWDMFPTTHTDFIVVGVAADAKYNSVQDETPRRFYVPFFHPIGEATAANFEVRTTGDPAAVVGALRAVVKKAAPNLPPLDIHTMNDLVSASLTTDRMITKLTGFFGGLAVLLACIGIYGIMAYAVAGRTGEIGIRMALGARRADVLWLVLRESLLLVVIGVAIGLPAVIAAGKLVASLLFGLTAADPATLALATALMFAVAALAGYIPAVRAARTDPMAALRNE
ncbi:MAG TPA: ABC transporter permease [Terriglobia bacterium]|nr:ABC transporter permease [Terriglobia bacterium]